MYITFMGMDRIKTPKDMSKHLPEVIEKQCTNCGHIYNLNEYDNCPICDRIHELSKDFLITTDEDDNNISPDQYYN